MTDLALRCTCDACPVQYEGRVDGKWLYFHARWGQWDCAIADSLDDAVIATLLSVPTAFARRGTDESDGYMEPEAAEAIMRRCVGEYRALARGDDIVFSVPAKRSFMVELEIVSVERVAPRFVAGDEE